MYSTAFSPSPALAGFVEHYTLWEDKARPGAPVLHPGLPVVANGINVLYGNTFEAVALATDGKTHPTALAETAGLAAWQQLCLRPTGRAGALGIYFRPTGFFHLFGVPMAEATDGALALGGVAGPFAGELARRVGTAATGPERLAVADELLLRQLRRRCPAPDAIDAVANCILDQHGQVNIEDLAHGAGLSRRQLERRFLAEVGAPPKLYARLARFHHVFELLTARPAPAWQDVAYLCGYYDQAHFIREFRHFTGQTPGAYALQDNDFDRFSLAR